MPSPTQTPNAGCAEVSPSRRTRTNGLNATSEGVGPYPHRLEPGSQRSAPLPAASLPPPTPLPRSGSIWAELRLPYKSTYNFRLPVQLMAPNV